jgi:hypothetical protein
MEIIIIPVRTAKYPLAEAYLGIVLFLGKSWTRAAVLRTPDSTPATIQRGDLDLSLMTLFSQPRNLQLFLQKVIFL